MRDHRKCFSVFDHRTSKPKQRKFVLVLLDPKKRKSSCVPVLKDSRKIGKNLCSSTLI